MRTTGAARNILCACLRVTEARVAAAVRGGRACSLREVMACTEAGTGCTACHQAIQAVVERHSSPPVPSPRAI